MKIKICKRCSGKGKKKETRYYNEEDKWEKCKDCNGTGKVLSDTYKYRLQTQYGSDDLFRKYDSLIVKFIRELNETIRKDFNVK